MSKGKKLTRNGEDVQSRPEEKDEKSDRKTDRQIETGRGNNARCNRLIMAETAYWRQPVLRH